MMVPWWLTRAGWQGFWWSFQASFDAGYHGADRPTAERAGLLATYRQLRAQDPDLTWSAYMEVVRRIKKGEKA